MKLFKLFIAFSCVLFVFSCKPKLDTNYQVGADIRDSVYIYAKDLYLWTDAMPDIFRFRPQSYRAPEDVITVVRTYSPVQNGFFVDRFSFVLPKASWDNTASGNRSDYGAGYRFRTADDLRISYVYSESAMGKQGVQRGWRLLKVNNITPDTSAATVSQLNNAFSTSTSLTVDFLKSDNTPTTLTFSPDTYVANFILDKRVIPYSGKKIAYLVLNSFLGANTGKDTQTALSAAFNEFSLQGATELIVDLRYNGGGYVFLAAHLSNLIAPASAKGQLMFKEVWNEQYKKFNETFTFDDSPDKLNLSKIVFITTASTASASELSINNMRPYLEVKIIGTKTSGKPVGFPVIPIIMSSSNPSLNYVVAPVAFQNFNAKNFGDYFGGLPPDKVQIDDVAKNFGDTSEACLKDALNFLTTGILLRSISQEDMLEQPIQANEKLNTEQHGSIKLMPSLSLKK